MGCRMRIFTSRNNSLSICNCSKIAIVSLIATICTKITGTLLPWLITDHSGNWSATYWDPHAHVGWRTFTQRFEIWVYVDPFSNHWTGDVSVSESERLVNASPSLDVSSGASPSALWEARKQCNVQWVKQKLTRAHGFANSAVNHYVVFVGHGWPFTDSWHIRWIDATWTTRSKYWIPLVPNDQRMDSTQRAQLGIPLGVVWSGFILNWTIWTSVLLTSSVTASYVRLLLNRRRGLCVYCGYSRTGVERCPECGRVGEPPK